MKLDKNRHEDHYRYGEIRASPTANSIISADVACVLGSTTHSLDSSMVWGLDVGTSWVGGWLAVSQVGTVEKWMDIEVHSRKENINKFKPFPFNETSRGSQRLPFDTVGFPRFQVLAELLGQHRRRVNLHCKSCEKCTPWRTTLYTIYIYIYAYRIPIDGSCFVNPPSLLLAGLGGKLHWYRMKRLTDCTRMEYLKHIWAGVKGTCCEPWPCPQHLQRPTAQPRWCLVEHLLTWLQKCMSKSANENSNHPTEHIEVQAGGR